MIDDRALAPRHLGTLIANMLSLDDPEPLGQQKHLLLITALDAYRTALGLRNQSSPGNQGKIENPRRQSPLAQLRLDSVS